jgi:hypothetical protein
MTRNGLVWVGALIVGVVAAIPAGPFGLSFAHEAADVSVAALRVLVSGAPAPTTAPPPAPAPPADLPSAPAGAPLWPVPRFEDGCQWSNAPSSIPSGGSALPPCDPGTSTPTAHHSGTDWPRLLAFLGVLGAVAVLGAVIGGGWWLLNRFRAERRSDNHRRAEQIRRWQTGTATLAEVNAAVMAFEMDPEAVFFSRPLLADVTEPATSAFYTAYGAAQDLQSAEIPTDDDAVAAFVGAAGAALRAFKAADANARRKAEQGIVHDGRVLTDDERHKLAQARTLMAQARDRSAHPQFAHVAYQKALTLINQAGVRAPERLVANTFDAIEAAHRRALPSAG